MSMRRLFIVVVASIMALGVVAESRFAGIWNGELRVGPNRLPIVLNISDSLGLLNVTLDSPAQGVTGIPTESSESGDTLKLAVPMLGVKYTGVKSGDAIVGTFSQQGYDFPLTLDAGPYVMERPQTPRPPFPYNVREVEFVNPADSALLSGTLTLPYTYQLCKPGSIPAVIMVTGSGLQNRDEEVFGHKPFAVIAHALALNGIASLRYDDRGFGHSTGNADGATTATFASDADAAIGFMRSQEKAFRSVGVLGHSEGGAVAFMLGAEAKPDFIVSLAGPAVSGDSILYVQNERILGGMGLTELQLKEYLDAFSTVISQMSADDEMSGSRAVDIDSKSFPNLSPEMKENLEALASKWNPWLDYFVKYDPASDIRSIVCPVFALNGELDTQVDARMNLAALRRLLPNNDKTVVKSYPGLNHLFQHASTGLPDEYGSIEETISEEVLADIVKWIKEILN